MGSGHTVFCAKKVGVFFDDPPYSSYMQLYLEIEEIISLKIHTYYIFIGNNINTTVVHLLSAIEMS